MYFIGIENMHDVWSATHIPDRDCKKSFTSRFNLPYTRVYRQTVDGPRSREVVGVTGFVEPTPHEFAANYLFDANGLAPFFAADSQVKAGDGSQRSEFHNGENDGRSRCTIRTVTSFIPVLGCQPALSGDSTKCASSG